MTAMEQLLYVAVRALIFSSVAAFPYSGHSGLLLTMTFNICKPNQQDTSWDLFYCVQSRARSLACDLCWFLACLPQCCCAEVKSPASNVSVPPLNLRSYFDKGRQKAIQIQGYRLHSMFETCWSSPSDNMSLHSNIRLSEDHESYASELLTRAHMHKITQHKSIQFPKTSQNNQKTVLFFH